MHPALACFKLVLAQTEADAGRLRASGADPVQVMGNLKFDMAPKPELLARGHRWAAALGRTVVMGAVTRAGEEAALLAAWVALLPLPVAPQTQPRPLLLLVPRHPQRFDEVAALVQQAGLTLARRSSWTDHPPAQAHNADVWLGDSLGEMPLYYATAQVALLGGSFEPLGGQNLIEAAACGCPLLMGPHTYNFTQAAELALAAGAARRCPSIAAAVAQALALCGSVERVQMAERALAFAAQHRGAARRMALAVGSLMAESGVERRVN